MATTTNYSWTTPDDTDLVKDGAAAIRTLGSSIDTTVFNNAGAAIQKSIVDAAGDLIYATADDTPARLAIGTAGQILQVNAGATAPEWAAAASAPSADYSLLNAGGTALTGSATVTISGISNKSTIFVLINQASSASANSKMNVRINGVSTSTYGVFGSILVQQPTYSVGALTQFGSISMSQITVGDMSNNAASKVSGYVKIDGCSTTGDKMFQYAGTGSDAGGANQEQHIGAGFLDTTAVTEVSVISSTGNFDNGTLYVYATE